MVEIPRGNRTLENEKMPENIKRKRYRINPTLFDIAKMVESDPKVKELAERKSKYIYWKEEKEK